MFFINKIGVQKKTNTQVIQINCFIIFIFLISPLKNFVLVVEIEIFTQLILLFSVSRFVRYSGVASTYALLAGSAYLHITQSSLRKKLNEDELKEDLLYFLETSQNLEKNARSGVPMVPVGIQDKITLREMKYQTGNNGIKNNFNISVFHNRKLQTSSFQNNSFQNNSFQNDNRNFKIQVSPKNVSPTEKRICE